MPYRLITWTENLVVPTPLLTKTFGPFSGQVWIDWVRSITSLVGPNQRPALEIGWVKDINSPAVIISNEHQSPWESQAGGTGTVSPFSTEEQTHYPICRANPFTPCAIRFTYEGGGLPANQFTVTSLIWTE